MLGIELGVDQRWSEGVNRGVKLQGDTGTRVLLIGFQVNDIIRS
jgi:hypothetical protein